MSSGFISEAELAEIRKKKQEEWEKVRKPDQPLERPEEPHDPRSLFDQLKDQKMKKDLEYEEAHKLKNLIRGLDDDEVEFLDFIDRNKMIAEKQQQIEEKRELEEFRQRVASLQEESSENKIQLETVTTKPKSKVLNHTAIRPSQKSMLSGIVRKRKNGDLEIETSSVCPSIKQQEKEHINENSLVKNQQQQKEDRKIGNKTTNNTSESDCSDKIKNIEEKIQNENSNSLPREMSISTTVKGDDGDNLLEIGALKCIGILPGIGKYNESSDSEISTDSEEEPHIPYGKYDLIGRRFEITRKSRTDDCDDDD